MNRDQHRELRRRRITLRIQAIHTELAELGDELEELDHEDDDAGTAPPAPPVRHLRIIKGGAAVAVLGAALAWLLRGARAHPVHTAAAALTAGAVAGVAIGVLATGRTPPPRPIRLEPGPVPSASSTPGASPAPGAVHRSVPAPGAPNLPGDTTTAPSSTPRGRRRRLPTPAPSASSSTPTSRPPSTPPPPPTRTPLRTPRPRPTPPLPCLIRVNLPPVITVCL